MFLLFALVALARGGRLTSGVTHGLEATHAQEIVERIIGRGLDTTLVVIFQSDTLGPDDQAFSDAMAKALEPLRHDPAIAAITTPDDAPASIALSMANAHEALAYVSFAGDFAEALGKYPEARAKLTSDVLQVTCTGKLAYMSDLNHTLQRDLLKAELLSLPLALLVLLLVFRTLVAALLPVGIGALAVVGGIAVVMQLSHVLEIAQYTVNVCSLIGLGVAIDYSLFTVSRYREERAAGGGNEAALMRTMESAGRVVAFSGLAVTTGICGLLFFRGSFLWAMGLGGAIVVALSVVFALTFLPALLAVLGDRIDAGRLPGLAIQPGRGLWRRMAEGVMRMPLRVLIPTLAFLLTLGIPFLHLRLAAADARVLDRSIEARRGYELLAKDFPDQGQTRLLVAVDFPPGPVLTADRIGGLVDLNERIAKLPNIAKVESLVSDLPVHGREAITQFLLSPPDLAKGSLVEAEKLSLGDHSAFFSVTTALAPESAGAQSLVRALRSQRHVGDGELLVGGQSAIDLDTQAFVLERAPYAVGFVLAVSFLILFLLLRSVLLPIKAMVMNLVSIAGSFGAMVWVFQDGHLWVREPRPLEPVLPVLLFCMLFGLSMDYEVLMLSRMKEHWDATHDNTRSVAEGLEQTAGLITSAAAIMVAVFSAFALASVVVVQAVGLGMALAVALDATLVRVLLVPATMRLFGDLNWWAPKWARKKTSKPGKPALA